MSFLKNIFLIVACCIFVACHSTTSTPDAADDKTDTPVTAKQKQDLADIDIQLGIGYLRKGDVQTAKQKLLAALQAAPDYPPANYAMGYYMETTSNLIEAEKYYTKALKLAPKNGDVQNNYGTFLCRNGHYRESLEHFELATHDLKYLDSAGAYANAGLCAEQIPDLVIAEKYFQRALQEDPHNKAAYLELSEIAYKQGKRTTAKSYLQYFNKLSPPTAQSLALARKLARS